MAQLAFKVGVEVRSWFLAPFLWAASNRSGCSQCPVSIKKSENKTAEKE